MSSSPDADLVVKALDHAWEQRGRPDKVMFHSDKGASTPAVSSASVCDLIGALFCTVSVLSCDWGWEYAATAEDDP